MGKTPAKKTAAKAVKASASSIGGGVTKWNCLSYLQQQCREHGLATSGQIAQLKHRLLDFLQLRTQANAEENDDERKPAAKTSETGVAIAKELVCPITLQLPFDPGMYCCTNSFLFEYRCDAF